MLSGFWIFALPESGVCDGTQKLGSCCFLEPVMLERVDDVLGPGWSGNGKKVVSLEVS